MNHMEVYCGSRNSAMPVAGATSLRWVVVSGLPWTSTFEIRCVVRRSSSGRAGRLSGFTRSRPRSVAVHASSSSQLGLAGSEADRTRKQIFEDGFAIFPRMWSKEEVSAAGGGLRVGGEQEKALKLFLMDPVMDPVGVDSQRQWVHAPGHRCTDAATLPEPFWHHFWQIAGLECEDLQMPSCSATLLVSLSDRNAKMFCGGVAVFPRSHWIIHDRIANSTSDQLPFPQPCDVPAAAPTELRLECGDMALLHPLLAFTIAPNVSSSPAQFLVFNLGDATCDQVKSRVDEVRQMWSGWRLMTNFLTDQTTNVEEEMLQLQTEEGKAQVGGWQNTMAGLKLDQLSLATSLRTRAAPRDILAWHLRTSAVQFMQDGQWSNALSMLLRRAGLRPTCYWTALQAGRCCLKSAPAGQLGGRAGRKCTLEDGERFLLRAIEIAPGWPIAYAELMRCLALMGRGREQEIARVMKVMNRCCNFQQLCLRYPTASDALEECWNDCEALCHTCSSGEELSY